MAGLNQFYCNQIPIFPVYWFLRHALFLLAFLGYLNLLYSQNQNPAFETEQFAQRDSTISLAISEESYHRAALLIDEQIEYLLNTGRYDSLYLYPYNAGRAYWKTRGGEAGVEKIEEVIELIFKYSRDTIHHLKSALDLSWLYWETGHVDKALEADILYVNIAENYSETEPERLSVGYYNLAFSYLDMGNPREASGYFQNAIEVLEGEDLTLLTESMINNYNALGASRYRLGDFRGAKQAFGESLEYIEQLEEEFDVVNNRSNVFGNLSLIYQDEGNLLKSGDLLEEAIMLRRGALEMAPPGYVADQIRNLLMSNYRNLASLYLNMGDHSRALQIMEYVKSVREKTLEPDDPRVAATLEGIASIYSAMREYERAVEMLEKYISLSTSSYGYYSLYTGYAYNNLGKVLLNMERYGDSGESFSTAIDIFKAITDENSSQDLANALIFRSRAYLGLGKYQLSQKDIEEALAIYRDTRSLNDPSLGLCYMRLADLYYRRSNFSVANSKIEMALEIFEEHRAQMTLEEDSPLTSVISYLPDAFYLKAKIERGRGSAEGNYLESAKYLDLAIEMIRNAKNLVVDEEDKLSMYDAHEDIFNLALENCYELYRITGDPLYIGKIFELAEENKSVMLRNQLNLFSSISFSGIPDSVVEREKYLMNLLTGKTPLPDDLEDIYELEWAYNQLIDEIEKKYPEYYQMRFGRNIPTLREFQSTFANEQTSVINFILTDQHAFVLVINKGDEHLIRLEVEDLERLVRQFNEMASFPGLKEFIPVGMELYQIIFKPIRHLIRADRLLIIPDKYVFDVNFDALITEMIPGGRPKFLIEEYTVSYLMSATTAMQYLELQTVPAQGVLAVAPGFSLALKEAYISKVKDSTLIDEQFLSMPPQPFAMNTAKKVADLFSGRALIDSTANKSNFIQLSSNYGLLHFGTHAEINNLSPLLSRLVLSGIGETEASTEEIYLHSFEIYNLKICASLAVLTACETGTGKKSNSEGVMSLAHSFAYAGCPSVIMSLWKIDEMTSASIIENFYSYLKERKPKNEALRLAKLDHLNSSPTELQSPYYWAGMVLVGDTSEVTSGRSNIYIFTVAGLSLLLLLIVFIAKKRSTKS